MRTVNSFLGALEEPLTRREMDILAHLAQKRSNPEIARLETLALSTVKWYVNEILGKLNVASRGEAVARAVDLGLLLKADAEVVAKFPPHNLPRQLLTFIGREREIDELSALVRSNPLVTVTGSGGVGKTRLALQTAAGLLAYYPNRVWLVELAPLNDAQLVPEAVVAALGLNSGSGLSPIQQLCEYFFSRECLLVLDNCEHLVAAAAVLVHALLLACPSLCILATSREILGVDGETAYRCPSLSLPVTGGSFDNLAQSEAVQLFLDRAQRASPGFSLSEANNAEVARICLRLDGIPLAIELAAARLRLLSVAQIAARLEDVFHLLSAGSRSDLPRHRTLRAAIDWSFELLSEAERRLLERLAVFAGSWNLEAAEAVCSDPSDGLLPAQEILHLLGQLVDKSVVEILADGPGGKRYRMLETIRQYAREQMPEGEVLALRNRHLDYFLAFCLEAEPHLIGKDLREWRERVDAELENLRQALAWSLSGSVEKGLRLAAALWWYWHGRMHLFQEEKEWLERLLAAEAAGPQELRVRPERRIARGKALKVLAHRHYRDVGEDHIANAIAREAMEIFGDLGEKYRVDWVTALSMAGELDMREVLELMRATGDRYYVTYVLWYLIISAMGEGDLRGCRFYLEESLALMREIGYKEGEDTILRHFARLEFMEGNLGRALELLDEAYLCLLAAGSKGKAHFGLSFRAEIALAKGEYAQAIQHYQASLEADRENGVTENIVDALVDLGRAAWASGKVDLAKEYCGEARQVAVKLGAAQYEFGMMYYVLARMALSQGQIEQASALLRDASIRASSETLSEPLKIQAFGVLAGVKGQARRAACIFGALERQSWLLNCISLREREEYQQALNAVRVALSPEDFATAWAEGQVMTTAQAIQYAQEELPGDGSS